MLDLAGVRGAIRPRAVGERTRPHVAKKVRLDLLAPPHLHARILAPVLARGAPFLCARFVGERQLRLGRGAGRPAGRKHFVVISSRWPRIATFVPYSERFVARASAGGRFATKCSLHPPYLSCPGRL